MVAKLGEALLELQPIDVDDEVDGRMESVILATGSRALAGCRTSCAVPLGIFTAMEVAAGLALAGDVRIETMADPEQPVGLPTRASPSQPAQSE